MVDLSSEYDVAHSSADSEPARRETGGTISFSDSFAGRVFGSAFAVAVVGAALGAYFQALGSGYRDSAVKIDQDGKAVVKALNDLDKIVNKKWLLTSQLVEELRKQAGDDKHPIDDKLQPIRKQFYTVNDDWERAHVDLSSQLEIYVDTRFGVGYDYYKIERVNATQCDDYALRDSPDDESAAWSVQLLLEISYHCQELIKRMVDAGVNPTPANSAELGPYDAPLNHAWWVNQVLQCVMVERALEVRSKSPAVSLLLSSSDTGPDYTAVRKGQSDDEKCVAPYRENGDWGRAGRFTPLRTH
jgi:hypothetical protein